MIFETERSIVRLFRDEDAEDAHRIYGDPDVMRYLGPGDLPGDPDVEFTRRGLAKTTARYAELDNGLGFWAIERREDGRVVGAVGLSAMPDGEVEVFYHLARAYWGQGYATEVARAALTHAFDVVKLERVVAYCYPENPASLAVLRKLGMSHVGQREAFGKQLEYFVIERD